MRFWRLIAVVSVSFALSLAAASGAGSKPTATRFAVTLHGSVVKQWTYTRTSVVNGCRTRTKAAGTRKIALRSSDVAIVTGRWSGGPSRARFAGSIPLAATVQQSGTKTTTVLSGVGCDLGTHRMRCPNVTRSFSDATTGVISRRRHRLGLLHVPDLVPSEFDNGCPGEPKNVKAVTGTLELAGAKYSESVLFASSTAGLTLQGSADISTRLFTGPGLVLQHVRWTLVLRHIG